jgi:hypothetical protein
MSVKLWGKRILGLLGALSLLTGWSGASVLRWLERHVLHRRPPIHVVSFLESDGVRLAFLVGGFLLLLLLLLDRLRQAHRPSHRRDHRPAQPEEWRRRLISLGASIVISSPEDDSGIDGWEADVNWLPELGAHVLLTLVPPTGAEHDQTLVCEVEDPSGKRIDTSDVRPPGVAGANGEWNRDYFVTYPFGSIQPRPDHLLAGPYTARWFSTLHRAGRRELARKTFFVTPTGEVEGATPPERDDPYLVPPKSLLLIESDSTTEFRAIDNTIQPDPRWLAETTKVMRLKGLAPSAEEIVWTPMTALLKVRNNYPTPQRVRAKVNDVDKFLGEGTPVFPLIWYENGLDAQELPSGGEGFLRFYQHFHWANVSHKDAPWRFWQQEATVTVQVWSDEPHSTTTKRFRVSLPQPNSWPHVAEVMASPASSLIP